MQSAALTGAQYLTRTLAGAGVRTIFSLSGNQIMPVYDACLDAGIRIVHVRHEAAAVFMADAYAQLTGEIGVALVTAGPGFANALSPLFSARLSESPVLLLSGDSAFSQDGAGAFQELAQTEIAEPLVKKSLRPRDADQLGAELARAIRIAKSGRPGPVHMALAFDVLCAPAGESIAAAGHNFDAVPESLSRETAARVCRLIAQAKQPLIVTGPASNRSRAGSLPDDLERAVNAPVICMESPRGLRDPSLGAVAELIGQADLIVLLGKTADFTTNFLGKGFGAADATFAIIDPEAEELDRAVAMGGERVVLFARADTRAAADAIIAAVDADGGNPRHDDWMGRIREAIAWRGEWPDTNQPVHPATLSRAASELIAGKDEDSIVVCDGGEFGQWAQAFSTARRRIINGPSGAIGGGICYAIAAKIAFPQAAVFVLMGDGTAGFHFAEFETAARERAPIIAVIGNDGRWNAEHQIQLRDYGPDRLIGCELSPGIRYDQAAAGLGCHGEFVETRQELAGAVERARQANLPACLNVIIESVPAPVFARKEPAAAMAH